MQTPTTINGYPIIASSPTPAGVGTLAGHVIMVDRGADTHQRYVTAWLSLGNHQWDWGRYIEDFKVAAYDFEERERTMKGH